MYFQELVYPVVLPAVCLSLGKVDEKAPTETLFSRGAGFSSQLLGQFSLTEAKVLLVFFASLVDNILDL